MTPVLKIFDEYGSVNVINTGPELIIAGVEIMRGESGDVAGVENFLAKINRLSEFDTEQAKSDARANLGVAVVDGGTF
jgi:hypothetical protein